VVELPAVEDKPDAPPPRRSSRLVIGLALAGVVLAVAFGVWRMRQAGAADRPKSLAVLPFRQLTPRPGDEYLGVGVADAVITRLSNLRELVVRPTGAVLRYASAADPAGRGP